MKYKAPVRLRRGQCLSPYTAPARIAMMTYYLYRRYRMWGSHSGGGEKPGSVQVFFKTFLQSKKFYHI